MSDRIILVPTYNEVRNIVELHGLIRQACSFDMLFIDDSSPDGTADSVRELMRSDPGVHLLSRPRKQGLGRAYADGFRLVSSEARWKRIFMMDADLSHQPLHIPAIDAALDSNDFVIGSRYIHGVSVLNWSIVRLNLSYAANRYVRLLTGMPFSDCTSGFRGFDSSVLPLLLEGGIRSSGYAFLFEMLFRVWRSGRRVGEIPIVFVERRHGTSKISARVFVESMLIPLWLRLRSLAAPRGHREA
jgi:dolichol-phosphate mannosyltransferase